MIPTLSQVCSLHAAFGTDIEDYAAGQCRSVELWFTKLEDYLEGHSVEDVRQLLDALSVRASVAGLQGGLLDSEAAARDEAWKLFRSRLQLSRELGIETIVVACDVSGPLTRLTIDRVRGSLVELAAAAGEASVRVALEFQGRAALGNNLQTAVALIEEVGSPSLGLCLDTFHFEIGPSKWADLGLLHAGNLFHVQLSDFADVPRELASDSDRILPGDGMLAFEPLLERLREIGYGGCVSLELMNPRIWLVPPRQFGEIAMTSLRKLLGLASMT